MPPRANQALTSGIYFYKSPFARKQTSDSISVPPCLRALRVNRPEAEQEEEVVSARLNERVRSEQGEGSLKFGDAPRARLEFHDF